MWSNVLAACARRYPSGVLTTVDSSGYPTSVRCTVTLDDAAQVIRLTTLPPLAADWRGPACLLFHRHDAHLEDQHQLLVRGDLAAAGATLVLRPSEFLTPTGRADHDALPHAGTPWQLLQFLRQGRRKARAYLAQRGAPWPPIPFDIVLAALAVPPDPTPAPEGGGEPTVMHRNVPEPCAFFASLR